MGSGSLAPRSNHRTGEGQTGKGASGSTRNFSESSKSKVFLPASTLPGSQDPARPTGRPCSCTDQPRERTFPPASEANVHTDMNHESNQANRAISTSQLNASPRLHTWPINVVVFHGSDREHSFRGGFPA